MGEIVICGVKFRMDFTFLVFAALVMIIEEGSVCIAFFTVCLVHELGHAGAICLTGGKISSVAFYGTGIRMTPLRGKIIPLKNELFILLAGPAVNALLFMIFRKSEILNRFAVLNLCSAVFNLLPYSSLDGGAAIGLIADSVKCGNVIRGAAKSAQLLLSVLLLLASLKERAAVPFFIVSLFYYAAEIRNYVLESL